ncbi:MAG: hypothetical protein WBA22_14340 [Candidatus Methanofastidiosia archaeon]
MIRTINPGEFTDRNHFNRWKERVLRGYPMWRGKFNTRAAFPLFLFVTFDAKELIMKIIEMIMTICELIAQVISQATQGFVPAEAVDEIGILILLILFRAGFDFTKKILDILIIIFAIYLVIRLLPSILAVI